MSGALETDGYAFRHQFGDIEKLVQRDISIERLTGSGGRLKTFTADSKTVLCWACDTRRPVEPTVSLIGPGGASPIFSKKFSIRYHCSQCLQCFGGARLHTSRKTSGKAGLCVILGKRPACAMVCTLQIRKVPPPDIRSEEAAMKAINTNIPSANIHVYQCNAKPPFSVLIGFSLDWSVLDWWKVVHAKRIKRPASRLARSFQLRSHC